MSGKELISVGILAHVDAGKTSLTECLLHKSGIINELGSVDKGSSITDNLSVEKDRGISVKAATVDFEWKERDIILVDTPGHIDFSAEVDRALSVLDMVILVVSAKEGIQAHTINLWETIQQRKLPVVIFVNKIDRAGADAESVFKDFEKDLGAKLFALNYPDLRQPESPKVVNFMECMDFISSFILDKSLENLAELDDDILEEYLEGKSKDLPLILEKAQYHIAKYQLIGVLFGSAKLALGIDSLLDELSKRDCGFRRNEKGISAKIFKVEYDPKFGRLAYVRSYGTLIKTKDVLWSQNLNKEVKINQIFKSNLGKKEQIKALNCGAIGMMSTSDLLLVGDVLGKDKLGDDFEVISQSVLMVEVKAVDEAQYQKLGEALEILNIEDPRLDFTWHKDIRVFHIRIMGPIQIEILKVELNIRFSIIAEFSAPKIIYKETPSKSAEGFVRYWMPKPCWAIMKFLIEPGVAGSGVVFESKVRTSDISQKYQNEVKRAIPWSLKQGIKGWEVTDLKITLLEGEEHTMHSNPGDFLLATPMGVMRAIEASGTDLLEPMYAFEIKAEMELLGAISSELNQMFAQINPPEFSGSSFILKGRVAVEKALNYSIQFNTTTSGRGRLKLKPDGYEKTEAAADKIRPFVGVSPLDEAKWILHNRGAFKADERLR